MTVIALVFSLAIAVLGGIGVVSPSRLLAVVRRFQTPAGLYTGTALRLLFGLALFLTAPESRAPDLLQVLGIVIMVAGLITPLFGLERFRRLLDWWSTRGPGFIRVWAAFALAFGLLLAYAVAV